MSKQNATPLARAYFSGRLLASTLGGPAALPAVVAEAMETNFALRVSRLAVTAWVQRDRVPGHIIAQMMLHAPQFNVRGLIALDAPPRPADILS